MAVNALLGLTQFATTTLQTVSDTDGAVQTFLQEIWNSPLALDMRVCVVTLAPTSSGGNFATSGRAITSSDPGLFFASGWSIIRLWSLQDVRNFRIQAQAGGTVYLTAAGWR